MTEEIVVTSDLGRSFGSVEAVRGLDLTVQAGEIFGFLGPNGAGKSTTIAMLCTLLRPSSGWAMVAEADVVSAADQVRQRIGVAFQEPTLDLDLTAAENLRFHAELHGIGRRELQRTVGSLLDLLGLEGQARTKARAFSGGMRRRLEIARSLVHRPRLLFLDEPTAGLDTHGRVLVWEHLRRLRDEHGVTLFVTTHYLEEAENCDRLCLIDHGRLVAEGSPAELKSMIGADIVHLRTADDTRAASLIGREFGLEATISPDGVRVHRGRGAELLPALCAKLDVPVLSAAVFRPSLDDVFLHYTGRTGSIQEGANPP